MNYAQNSDVWPYLYALDLTPLTRGGMTVDFFITQQLTIVKKQMDMAMNRRNNGLDLQTLTDRRVNGMGGIAQLLPWWPIKTVTRCVINYGWGSGMYTFSSIHHKASSLLGLPADPPDQQADLIVDRDKGIIEINPSSLKLVSMQGNVSPLWNWVFTEGDDNVEIDLIQGWDFTPGVDPLAPVDIIAAQAMMVAAKIADMAGARASQGASSVKIGSVSRSWGKPYANLISDWNDQAKAILAYYEIREAFE